MATQFAYECWCSEELELDYERHGVEADCDHPCMGDEVCVFAVYRDDLRVVRVVVWHVVMTETTADTNYSCNTKVISPPCRAPRSTNKHSLRCSIYHTVHPPISSVHSGIIDKQTSKLVLCLSSQRPDQIATKNDLHCCCCRLHKHHVLFVYNS